DAGRRLFYCFFPLVINDQALCQQPHVELMERDIFPVVMGALEEFGLPPANVTLELTESCMVKEDKQVNKIMGRFREAGLKVAMDDFGTGYSSLYSLKNISADVVKIDRSFVTGITEVGFNATLIRSVAQLCGQVDMRVCVEGVETEAEHSAVKGMGVELIQGYYFGRPMLPELFEQKFMGT
ncbi:EAL domain-containing protein, partial [Enterocloster lavalensis]|uniref:EAL domain-containing protein n=1 Tax=Enterocloster lavalensis TaxID=460384 RepID=UPI0034A33A7B